MGKLVNLELEIKKSKVLLRLSSDKERRDVLAWKDDNSLSRLLLEKIDKLLSRNKIGLDKISGYKIISNVPKNWTSVRIAEITLKSLILAKNAKNFPRKKLTGKCLPK